ncbi:hypothetical protein [Nonomuraea sp. SBT364]|uniref:hypothetical protein n=1 Tax=Nonomuraea sp. SBT364 TaxID=1580530 RepID=UPI00066A80F0|nr:hypothetical protein [Nonomuraea sp. SBT364]
MNSIRTPVDRALIAAEWRGLTGARGRVAGLLTAPLATVLLSLAVAGTVSVTCSNGPVEEPCQAPISGPGGQAVVDDFTYVHLPLRGDGSITVRVNSMTGRIKEPPPPGTGGGPPPVPGLVPWAKAGVLVKDGIREGSQYAAIMVTARHGVRMQHDFTEDTAGSAGGFPRWLRLTRTGDTLTGSESADGKQWSEVGTAHLTGLPYTVNVGLFAASPGDVTVEDGGAGQATRFAEATAVFDQVSLQGVPAGADWTFDDIGARVEDDGVTVHHPGAFARSGDEFVLTGAGDIGPNWVGLAVERSLLGQYVGLIPLIMVAVSFATADGRRALAVLGARSVVIGAAAFATGLVSAAITLPIGSALLRGNAVYPLPVGLPTQLRVIVGTGLLFAAVAVLALGLGALLRRGAVAVSVAVAVTMVPLLLAVTASLPMDVSQWLLRVTPAAGFSIQQSLPEYDHIDAFYTPFLGYFPLAPWAGFGVLCAYGVLAVFLAARR